MDDPRRFLPLTPQQFHILLALTDGHLHGYAIIREVADRTGGRAWKRSRSSRSPTAAPRRRKTTSDGGTTG